MAHQGYLVSCSLIWRGLVWRPAKAWCMCLYIL